MNEIIEILGFIAGIALISSWIPKIRENQQLFNILTLIAVLAFFVQFIILGVITNIIIECALLILTITAIIREYQKSD